MPLNKVTKPKLVEGYTASPAAKLALNRAHSSESQWRNG